MKLPVLNGPLDELAAPIDRDAVPLRAVHARVLPLDAPDEGYRALACFFDPGGPLALHRALKPRVEATVLLSLVEVPELARHEAPALRGLSLTVWPRIAEVERATRAFGLTPADAKSDRAKRTFARMRGEASALGARIPDEPVGYFEALVAPPTERAIALDRAMQGRIDAPWGVKPGAYAAALLGGATPTMSAIDALVRDVVSNEPGVIRMMPPRVFLGLSDLVGVAASKELALPIEWSDCSTTSDEHDDFAPPPMLRFVSPQEGEVIVPIAEELLRFCVMPLAIGETLPPTSELLRTLFR